MDAAVQPSVTATILTARLNEQRSTAAVALYYHDGAMLFRYCVVWAFALGIGSCCKTASPAIMHIPKWEVTAERTALICAGGCTSAHTIHSGVCVQLTVGESSKVYESYGQPTAPSKLSTLSARLSSSSAWDEHSNRSAVDHRLVHPAALWLP